LLALLMGCASSRSIRSPESEIQRRFRDPEQIVIVPPRNERQPTPIRSAMLPVPRRRPPTIFDRLAVAYIVDTLGRVEYQSVSFVVAPQSREFVTSICQFLDKAQFTRPERRTLLLSSWSFDRVNAPSPPAPFVVDTLGDRLRAAARDSVFRELAARRHCP